MTTGGWLTMIVSVGSVVALFGWCLYRVLFCVPPQEVDRLHGVDNVKPKDLT